MKHFLICIGLTISIIKSRFLGAPLALLSQPRLLLPPLFLRQHHQKHQPKRLLLHERLHQLQSSLKLHLRISKDFSQADQSNSKLKILVKQNIHLITIATREILQAKQELNRY